MHVYYLSAVCQCELSYRLDDIVYCKYPKTYIVCIQYIITSEKEIEGFVSFQSCKVCKFFPWRLIIKSIDIINAGISTLINKNETKSHTPMKIKKFN